MRLNHALLAILIMIIWGFNFVVIHVGLKQISPQILCMTRFFGASFPAIFFVKKPTAPFRIIMLYGLVMFALQFSFLFFGMQVGMPPGLSSLLVQIQVFFTILLAFIFLGEKPLKRQLIGAAISFSGIALVALHLDKHISYVGFFLVLAAAASWSLGNLISKKIGKVNMFSLVVWGSFVAWWPLLIITLLIDGSHQVLNSLLELNWLSIGAILYLIYLSTIVGYVGWNWLLTRYAAATIAPFTLLVPVFGMMSAAFFMHEPLESWKLIAGALVILGICINLFAKRRGRPSSTQPLPN